MSTATYEPIDWAYYGVPRERNLPTDWVHVLTMDDGGGYEWSTLHAFYSPSARRYFWLADFGCSCNWWGDFIESEADFNNGKKDDLERAIRAFAAERGLGPEVAFDALADLRRFKTKHLNNG